MTYRGELTMSNRKRQHRHFIASTVWLSAALILGGVYSATFERDDYILWPKWIGGGGLVCLVFGAYEMTMLLIDSYTFRHKKPAIENVMLSRPLKAVVAGTVLLIFMYCLGKLEAFGTFFSLFGGLLLGWSLQAPLSGLVAWFLISLKRSIRPGDRVQFPDLKLTGDIEDIGAMYVTLNQVGGSIASEEAVGRRVLIPNAMLFNNVMINYTVTQEAAYILDEVVVRITYNSDWERAEAILLDAAYAVTSDIITATGIKPYIRSNLYDYGIYMRLRFKTRVQDRALIAYQIEKNICKAIQKTPCVDIAIPYVYSYRTAMDENAKDRGGTEPETISRIAINKIRSDPYIGDPNDIRQLSESIAEKGLLQPIVVSEEADGYYRIKAGHLRFEACKSSGWDTIAAVVHDHGDQAAG